MYHFCCFFTLLDTKWVGYKNFRCRESEFYFQKPGNESANGHTLPLKFPFLFMEPKRKTQIHESDALEAPVKTWR